jgi:hypothetical protein
MASSDMHQHAGLSWFRLLLLLVIQGNSLPFKLMGTSVISLISRRIFIINLAYDRLKKRVEAVFEPSLSLS